MAGELTPMPLADILGGIGYKTAMGDWPPGFDTAHALLTLVHLAEQMRKSIVAHHEAHPHLYSVDGYPCSVCMRAQNAEPEDVLTDLRAPDVIPESMRGRPDDNKKGGVWCGVSAAGNFCCTRPAGHTGLHYSDDGGWG